MFQAGAGLLFLAVRLCDLMVVNDFDFIRVSVLPPKTNATAVVDQDAVLSDALTAQRLQSVPGQAGQVAELCRVVEHRELAQRSALQLGGRPASRLAVSHNRCVPRSAQPLITLPDNNVTHSEPPAPLRSPTDSRQPPVTG